MRGISWGTQKTEDLFPHGTQDIPPRYSWYPPTVLNTPHGTQDIPQNYHISPRYLTPPRYWAPPTVLNTLYRVIIEAEICPHKFSWRGGELTQVGQLLKFYTSVPVHLSVPTQLNEFCKSKTWEEKNSFVLQLYSIDAAVCSIFSWL